MMQDEPLLSDEAEADDLDSNDADEDEALEAKPFVVILPLAVFVFLFGATLTILYNTYIQYVLSRFLNGSAALNDSTCDTSSPNPEAEDAQEKSSWIMAKAQIAAGVPSIVMAVLYGSLSDRCGRIPTLALPWVGCLFFFLLTCVHVAVDSGFWVFLLGAAIFGLAGNFVAYLAATFALLADLTSPHQRNLAIVVMEAVLGMATVFGSLIDGYVIKATGLKTPIYAAAGVFVATGLLFFFLNEPRLSERRVRALSRQYSFAMRLRDFLEHVRDTMTADKERTIISCFYIAAFFLQVFCYIGSLNILVLYLLNAPFCFSPVHLGMFQAGVGASLQIGSAGFVWVLQGRLSDTLITIIGFASYASANVLKGLASSLAYPAVLSVLILSVLTGILGTIPAGMIRATLSKLFDNDSQGVIFALTASAETLATILGGLILNALYATTLNFLRGFVFYFMSGLNVLSIVFILLGSWRHRRLMVVLPPDRL